MAAQRESDPQAKIKSAYEQIALIQIYLAEHPELSPDQVRIQQNRMSELRVDIEVAEGQYPAQQPRRSHSPGRTQEDDQKSVHPPSSHHASIQIDRSAAEPMPGSLQARFGPKPDQESIHTHKDILSFYTPPRR
jgi:hypothetical protein